MSDNGSHPSNGSELNAAAAGILTYYASAALSYDWPEHMSFCPFPPGSLNGCTMAIERRTGLPVDGVLHHLPGGACTCARRPDGSGEVDGEAVVGTWLSIWMLIQLRAFQMGPVLRRVDCLARYRDALVAGEARAAELGVPFGGAWPDAWTEGLQANFVRLFGYPEDHAADVPGSLDLSRLTITGGSGAH